MLATDRLPNFYLSLKALYKYKLLSDILVTSLLIFYSTILCKEKIGNIYGFFKSFVRLEMLS